MEERKSNDKIKSGDEEFDHLRFSTLVDLFEAMGINEKGIEIVYDYLLTKDSIEDLKAVSEKLDLSLKRIYKILAVLKDMGLIQVYDRPMKIYKTDIMKSWQELISRKITQLKAEMNEKIDLCQHSLQKMFKAYKVPEQAVAPPVEFVNYSINENPLELLQNLMNIKRQCFITKEMRFNHPPNLEILKVLKEPTKYQYKNVDEIIEFIRKIFTKLEIKILLNEEIASDIIENTNELDAYKDFFKIVSNIPVNIHIRVAKQSVGNFIIKDDQELLQLSFAPNNLLVGAFISRQNEITDIFSKKFNDIYKEAEEIEKYMEQSKHRPITPIDLLIFLIA